MSSISIEELQKRCDSLYRLVIAGARRASQVAKPDTRPLVPVRSKKSTIIALEEILQGKVDVVRAPSDDEEFVE